MTTRPNIVLVVLDTARADAFEPYGARPGASPAVQQLADRGAAAPHAYAPACWTVPSHVSLFSGLLPRTAGIDHRGGGDHAHFRAALEHHRDRLLPAVLARQGWETVGVSANHWIHELSGFDLGFDEFHSVHSPRTRAFDQTGWRSAATWYGDALRARLDDGAERIAEILRAWRRPRAQATKPFFWFVNLLECHSPYLPPTPWTTLGPIARMRAAAEARRHLSFESIWMSSVGGFHVPDGAIDRMRRQYAGAIAQLDAWLARLLQDLDDAGVLDDTQVIVTSDHGENFGEGGLLGHCFSLDDRLLRIPFVTGGPLDLDPGPHPWSLVGTPHLLGEALDLDHPWREPAWGPVPVAQFDAPGTPENPAMYEAVERWGLGADAVARLSTSFACATDGRHKLLRRDGVDLLVDVTVDPLETRPVPVDVEDPAAPEITALRAALDRAEAEEVPAIALADGPAAPAHVSADEQARIEEQMRMLGYL